MTRKPWEWLRQTHLHVKLPFSTVYAAPHAAVPVAQVQGGVSAGGDGVARWLWQASRGHGRRDGGRSSSARWKGKNRRDKKCDPQCNLLLHQSFCEAGRNLFGPKQLFFFACSVSSIWTYKVTAVVKEHCTCSWKILLFCSNLGANADDPGEQSCVACGKLYCRSFYASEWQDQGTAGSFFSCPTVLFCRFWFIFKSPIVKGTVTQSGCQVNCPSLPFSTSCFFLIKLHKNKHHVVPFTPNNTKKKGCVIKIG